MSYTVHRFVKHVKWGMLVVEKLIFKSVKRATRDKSYYHDSYISRLSPNFGFSSPFYPHNNVHNTDSFIWNTK